MSLKLGNLKISSTAFEQHGRIPKTYAGDGANKSPPLEWSGAPSGTQQFAIVCHDPDAPLPHGFTHWVVYGIPSTTTKLSEGQDASAFVAGVNDTGKAGYLGPYPPNGHGVHHYYFWLFALGSAPSLKPGMARIQLLDAIKGSTLEQARVVGTYER
ncbi:MAG: YbhB/YbcL family Raf kinase inhibitor-like protein [Nitrososphaerota archaeon]|jgi:Raf kinase inhibitor-like YbhB/YbcL family protein|nr:YbhB/YbcL family Raf kinase inhibitor-like protein [Nitrososphaerota archaeon]MDG6966347.1 YbhB/YbcL family Raf kinase inhibitor-like protein [Nitrososphaerota archaeon]MDG6977782.1 YbhB/YbcL family Raf kinase inhibitor-like protein [Nitrososphaerota archaeon]MDG7006211.1 YbhB/YbcL family Raf kinase inhibitor-like protein [Nitrososphaerota archaeon]MDG7020850.1 YbhB/YbcL family Raf kinase inhibitor-like protein [Nitrososphaerota archaeon]